VQFVDVPVMAAYLMLIALIFVVINLIVDLLYYVSIRACAWTAPMRALMGDEPCPPNRATGCAVPRALRSRLARAWDSDLAWSSGIRRWRWWRRWWR
jgi:hypothetical protein